MSFYISISSCHYIIRTYALFKVKYFCCFEHDIFTGGGIVIQAVDGEGKSVDIEREEDDDGSIFLKPAIGSEGKIVVVPNQNGGSIVISPSDKAPKGGKGDITVQTEEPSGDDAIDAGKLVVEVVTGSGDGESTTTTTPAPPSGEIQVDVVDSKEGSADKEGGGSDDTDDGNTPDPPEDESEEAEEAAEAEAFTEDGDNDYSQETPDTES